MRAIRAAKGQMTVNLKCRNDQIRANRVENKVKPSNIENSLHVVNAREKMYHFVNMKCRNDNKCAENKVK